MRAAAGVSVRTHRQTIETGATVTAVTVAPPGVAQDPVERLNEIPAGLTLSPEKRA